jgi:hypothetical protein
MLKKILRKVVDASDNFDLWYVVYMSPNTLTKAILKVIHAIDSVIFGLYIHAKY